MEYAYDVAVRLGMQTSGFATAAGLATRLLNDVEGKATAAERAVARLAQRFNLPVDQFTAQATSMGKYTTEINAAAAAHANFAKAQGGIGKMIVGAGLVGIGLAGISAMKGAVTAAGAMQDAITQVGIAAQGTQPQLDALYTQSFAVANQTQYSGSAVLTMDQIMARMNFNDPTGKQTQRQVIHDAIPQFARAAEIAQHFQGTGYEDTITGLSQQAHMMGAYSGAALARNVGYSTQLGIVSHMTAQEQANALSYLTPSMKTGQLDTLDAMALVALSNQTGLNQGRGASNLGALMRGLAPTGAHKHDSGLAAIERLGGGNFYDAKGDAVPLTTALGILNRFYDNKTVTNERKGVLAQRGLGVQGARAAAVMGSDLSINQFGGLRTRIAGGTPAASEEEQRQLNATLPGQLNTLTGNIGSLSALMGKGLLPVVTPLVHGLVAATGALVDFLSHHEEIAKFASLFVAVGSATAVVVGGILAIQGAMALMGAAAALSNVSIGISLGPVALIFGSIAAVAVVAALAIQNWGTITGALTGKLGPLWQAVSVGGVAIAGFAGVMKLASAATLIWSGALKVASAATLIWSRALKVASASAAAWALATKAATLITGAVVAAQTLMGTALTFLSLRFDLAGKAAVAWSVLTKGAALVSGLVTGAVGLMGAALTFLSARFGLAGAASVAWSVVTRGAALISAGFSAAMLAMETALLAFSGGFSIATVAGAVLDVVLSPIIAIPVAIAAAIGAGIWVWTHWSQVMDMVTGKAGILGVALGVALSPIIVTVGAIKLLIAAWDALNNRPTPKLNTFTAGVSTTPTGATHPVTGGTTGAPARRGHYVMAGRTEVWVPEAASTASPTRTTPHTAPAVRAGTAARAGAGAAEVHNHYHKHVTIAKDALNLTVTPHPGQSPSQIGDHVKKTVVTDVAKELAHAFHDAHGFTGLVPSSDARW